jgi:hypothetical protein
MYRSLFNDTSLLEVLFMLERCNGMFLNRKFKGMEKDYPWLFSMELKRISRG